MVSTHWSVTIPVINEANKPRSNTCSRVVSCFPLPVISGISLGLSFCANVQRKQVSVALWLLVNTVLPTVNPTLCLSPFSEHRDSHMWIFPIESDSAMTTSLLYPKRIFCSFLHFSEVGAPRDQKLTQND